MKKISFIIILSVLFSSSLSLVGQNKSLTINVKNFDAFDKQNLDKAETLYSDMNYFQAIPLYEDLNKKYPEELYIAYRLGMCYLKKQDAYDKAVSLFEQVAQKNPDAADVKFYLGTAYHLTYKFDEAIKEFNEYLKQNIIKSQRPITEHLIEQCNNAKELLKNPLDVSINNIGKPINSEYAEYVPVISSDEQNMLFTYMGKKSKGGFEDIFSTKKDKENNWEEPKALGDNINGYNHDACIALSPDGNILFIYRDSKDKKGEIYYSNKIGKNWSDPLPLLGEVNTNHWEGSASLTTDGKTLYFTSDKPGGLGGRDIYKATLINDSIWGNVENLGPTINTPYNDDAPFIHPDGVTLVFSSEGHNSMGSYDIFHTQLKNDGSWITPKNIGYPINSPDRDTYYVLSADGKTGYYSSGRPGGFGMQDIYTVQPGLEGYIPKAAMIKGIVTLNHEPVEADITVMYKNSREVYSSLVSNKETGEYLTMLPLNELYEIAYKIKNYDLTKLAGDSVQLRFVEVANVDTFIEINVNVEFFTPDQLNPEPSELDTLSTEDLILMFGNTELEGLEYKVQIAAYTNPENYVYKHLKGLGDVEKIVLDDGITRFTIGGSFSTLNKAAEHNKKVIAKGQTDAFVTAIYKGKRVYLRELYNEGILKRK